jgi:hypothetical protein
MHAELSSVKVKQIRYIEHVAVAVRLMLNRYVRNVC